MEVTADLKQMNVDFFCFDNDKAEVEETKEYLSLMGVDPEEPWSTPETLNPEPPWSRPDWLSNNYSNSNYGSIVTLRVPMATAESDFEPEEEDDEEKEEEEEEEEEQEVRYYQRVEGSGTKEVVLVGKS